MALAKGDVVSSLSLTGPVSGTDSADVVSNLHSEVLEIRVKEGDTVEKGQVLAVIDRTDAQKEVDVARTLTIWRSASIMKASETRKLAMRRQNRITAQPA